MPTELPALSVVLVLFNSDRELLERCLDSLVDASSSAELPIEVVAFDNASRVPPALHQLFSSEWVTVRSHRSEVNLGFGMAANRGVRSASSKNILLLNPDAALSNARALTALLNTLEDMPRAIITGWLYGSAGVQVDAYRHWWTSLGYRVERKRWATKLEVGASGLVPFPVQKACGGALFASRELLLDLGPFDEDFFLYGEDADLSIRARRRGIPILVAPSVTVAHIGAASQHTFGSVVERARTDAALRLAAKHKKVLLNIYVRFELWLVSALGVLLTSSSSAGRASRLARFRELARWKWHKSTGRMIP